MHYINTEEVAQMVQADLLSSLSGVLGLFLGMRLLSFVEVIDVLWKIIQAFFF